jgi:hypothetical protein
VATHHRIATGRSVEVVAQDPLGAVDHSPAPLTNRCAVQDYNLLSHHQYAGTAVAKPSGEAFGV